MTLQQTSTRELIGEQLNSRRMLGYVAAIIILAIAAVMWIAAASALRKPFVMDEMEFPAVAQAIKATGLPYYYRGETHINNLGLWHPPFYILTLAAWQVVFGSSVFSNRAYGLFNACLALALIGIFTARRWQWRGIAWRQNATLVPVLLIGMATAATAPLYIQGAILPDIDTQVLPLLITGCFLFLFALRQRVSGWLYWGGFVLALVVQFFAKLTTPVLLIPAFMVFEFIRAIAQPRPEPQAATRLVDQNNSLSSPPAGRRAISNLFKQIGLHGLANIVLPIVAGVASLILMAGLWFIMARVWGVSFRLPFVYLTQSTNNPASLGSSPQQIVVAMIASMPRHFRYFTQWVGYPVLLMFLFMLVREFLHPTDGVLFVWERAAFYAFVGLLTCMYIVLKPAPFDFPKYYPPLIPLLAVLVIDLLVALHKEQRLFFASVVLGLEALAYIVYIATSSTLKDQDFIYQVYFSWPTMPVFVSWIFIPLLIGLIANGLLWLFVKRKFGAPLIIAALAVALGWQITTAARQSVVPYATTYLYGEQSLAKVVDYLRADLPDKTILIAPKDIGFMLEDRWRYIELDVDPRPYLHSPGVDYLVYRSNDYYGHTLEETPEVNAAVQQDFEVAATIDNFIVMRRKALAARN